MNLRRAAVALAVVTLLAGVSLSLGPPRVLWLNRGLRIEYAGARGAAAFVAAAAAAGLAGVIGKRFGRAALAVVALGAAAFGASLLLYRLEAVEDALRVRTLLGTTAIPWTAIDRVDTGKDALAVTAGGRTTRVGIGALTGDERAALERTVARRVREAGERREGREAPAGGEGPARPKFPLKDRL